MSGQVQIFPGFLLNDTAFGEDVDNNKLNRLITELSLRIASGAVTTRELADGSITADKLAEDIAAQLGIPDGSVTTLKLADGSVTTVKLEDNVLSNDAEGHGKMEDGYLQENHYGTDSVSQRALAPDSVGSTELIDGGILPEDMSFDAKFPLASVAAWTHYSAGSSQSIPRTTTTEINLDTAQTGNQDGGRFNVGTHKFTATTSGLYFVRGAVELGNTLSGRQFYASILKNGLAGNWTLLGTTSTGSAFGSAIPELSEVCGITLLQPGDTLSLAAWHNAILSKTIQVNPVKNMMQIGMMFRLG